MASSFENVSMALFCDFENVALGVRDAKYDKFDIKPILERLLLKGSIVVKKAYCDWERYKSYKAAMHEANFELIEIPHVRQSGKNSADIRLVVDALDLCYTKAHVNTFVIISGDSDFSPLVSKLRENAKQVIGVGVKQSTSDLLIANCDEFIYYDDLVRETQRTAAKHESKEAQPTSKRTPADEKARKEELEARKTKAIDLAVETFDALLFERGDSGKIWASVLKEAIKRRKPGFSESYYGFRAFINLLEEGQARGLLEYGRDEKSNAYVFRSGNTARSEALKEASPDEVAVEEAVADVVDATSAANVATTSTGKPETRRRTRGGRNRNSAAAPHSEPVSEAPPVEAVGAEVVATPVTEADSKPKGRQRTKGGRNRSDVATPLDESASEAPNLAAPDAQDVAAAVAEVSEAAPEKRRKSRGGRKAVEKADEASIPTAIEAVASTSSNSEALTAPAAPKQKPAKAARSTAGRPRRPRTPATDAS